MGLTAHSLKMRSDGADLCDFALAVSRTAERFDDDRFLADWIHSTRASEYLLSGEGAGEMARRYF